MCQIIRVFLSKVARPTISRESGEGDPHDLRSLRTTLVHRITARAPTAEAFCGFSIVFYICLSDVWVTDLGP